MRYQAKLCILEMKLIDKHNKPFRYFIINLRLANLPQGGFIFSKNYKRY